MTTKLRIGQERATRILEQLIAAGHCARPENFQGPKPPAPKEPAFRLPRNTPNAQQPAPPPFQGEDFEVPEDMEAVADLTLRELIAKHGTGKRMSDWLRALKEIEMVEEKRIKNAQSRGKLISRVLVETGVIDEFNSVHLRIMSDGAKAITAAVVAKHSAGIDAQEIEDYVRGILGSFISPVKSKIARNLASVAAD
jgi:hypothetical protein